MSDIDFIRRDSNLAKLVPKYRLATATAVRCDDVWSHYFGGVAQLAVLGGSHSIDLPTGSVLVLHSSLDPDRVFVEMHCQLVPMQRGVDLASAEDFVLFCASSGSAIRIVRNRHTIPASSGALFSDLKWSRSYRWAMHLACNPRDYAAQSRFAGTLE